MASTKAPKAPTLKNYNYVNAGSMQKGSGVTYKSADEYGKFEYDPLKDASYQALAKVYNANGMRAANDTLGQAAALNGGYGSSYAVAAAQQTRNDYNQQLAAMVPDLEQNAYQRWNNDRQYDFDVNQARDSQWYQNMGLYLDAISSNNAAINNRNSDLLDRANYGLNVAQFNWQKKTAKSGGGGGGRRGRSGGGGGGYYGGYGSSSGSSGGSGITGNASGNYMVINKGKNVGESSTYKGNVAVDKKGTPTKKQGKSVKGGAKGSQGYNIKTKTGSFRKRK